jgi:ribonuclease R
MIDSVSARDRDDAFSVVARSDGHGWAVEVHIGFVDYACVYPFLG